MKPISVYLASASPRRRELLDQIVIDYTIIIPDVDESHLDDISPSAYTERVALSKALYAQTMIEEQNRPSLPIIAADTAVVIENTVLGKPQNKAHATEMLKRLSGQTHRVYSSIALVDGDFSEVITQISEVHMREITLEEIHHYWASGEPQDKAGAYAIQGLGARFISHLSGSYSGVMGLPIFELTQLLAKLDP